MKPTITLCLLLGCFLSMAQKPKKSETVSVNGHKIYYEVQGQGKPLLLLHGYSMSSKSWLEFLPAYTSTYEVVLVDLEGHGQSESYQDNLSIADMAKDVAELLNYLNIKQVDAIGFSMGGDVLFHLAARHPGLIKSMISIGAVGFWNASEFPGWIEYFKFKNRQNLKHMNGQHRSEDQIKIILDQFPNYKTSITDEDMKKIDAHVMILIGDKDDAIPFEYLARVRKNLPNTFFWILPNTQHPAHYGPHKEDFIKISKEFLNGKWNKELK